MLNICCVIGLAPTTGKPLPFISSGGSSLIATLVMVGFVLASSEYEAMPDEYERRRRNFKASVNKENQEKIVQLIAKLDALSPLKTLIRGYCIASTENGNVIKSVKNLKTNDTIELKFTDGKAISKII